MRIKPEVFTKWRIATKIRPIKVKMIKDIIDVTSVVFDKFLLKTLEGNEPLRPDAAVCIGEAGDVWMQSMEKIDKKYTPEPPDIDGWTPFNPRPENEVQAMEVNFVHDVFSIIGQWGETIEDEKNVQSGVAGDFICRNPTDLTDVWIVKRRLYLNTYAFKT